MASIAKFLPMDLKTFKLKLVQEILRCEDPEVLRAVQQVLLLDRKRGETGPPSAPLTGDARELQQSLDDLFSGKAWPEDPE